MFRYVQFFKNDWTDSLLKKVGGIWDSMSSMNKKAGIGFRPSNDEGGRLLISCQSVHNPYGRGDECTMGGKQNYAITRNYFKTADKPNEYTSSSINFCDAFFHQPSFKIRKAVIVDKLGPTDDLDGHEISLEEYDGAVRLIEGDEGTDGESCFFLPWRLC